MKRDPLIIINLKTYQEGTGENALEIAKACEKVAVDTGAHIGVAVQALDLRMIAEEVAIPVYAQHVDGVGFGKHTGAVMPEALKQAGATGSLINHSEWKIPKRYIEAAVKKCREAGLEIVVCADTPEEASEVAAFKPDLIAIEPPELIGGNVSVSTARPEVITDTLQAVGKIPVLCGAGVKNKHDVAKAQELGAIGVLVASGVVKSDDPEMALRDLVAGLT